MILSSLSDKALNWQNLQPQLELVKIPDEPFDFWTLQPAAAQGMKVFMQNVARSLLILKVDEKEAHTPLISEFITRYQTKERSVFGVNYIIEQGDSFSFPQVNIESAQSCEDNFAAQGKVLSALYYDQFQLFGSVQFHPNSKDIRLNPGLIHQANGGVLILNASHLVTHSDIWQRLKHILQSRIFDWYSTHPFKPLPCEIPGYMLELKVILLANREELAMLGELEPELYSFADYAEVQNYVSISTQVEQLRWMQYIRQIAAQHKLQLDHSALNKLYQLLVRESEDRFMISISALQLVTILQSAATLTHKTKLSAVDFDQVFRQKQQQRGYLRERAYADILNEQIYVATEGEVVGQINGLSVIEYPGTPIIYGEPSRISCIVQFGEGEVVDLERKNELAGNIHSKGMMIAEACLANVLDLPSQLPFSATLVFEQSYGEIDGDSASLAGFCVLVSALADLPLPQNIAVTGTIDQFGLVHTVGGVNDKIEGFFAICQQRGLTGKQGVVIPTSTIQQLSLSEDVVNAVKNEQFFIFPVEDVFQTCELLFNRELVEENKSYSDSDEPLSRLIQRRITVNSEAPKKGFFNFFR
ncbi:AAA family ATPase [Rodentibacter caecimuris]|uniref:endopeptidase La n=1 Tax=Rodentibacter caecimuris TaxID=1796644 RepID=A0ABX3KXU3_9PAST|nr:peptidase [Rodentibacter heylii]